MHNSAGPKLMSSGFNCLDHWSGGTHTYTSTRWIHLERMDDILLAVVWYSDSDFGNVS